MSDEKPASFSSSSLVAANGDPGKTMPPTVCTLAILASCGGPCQRSIARVKARRTRTLSNGFTLVVGFQESAAVPVAGLHGELVAQRSDQFVAHRGREAAKLDRGAVPAQRVDPTRLFFRIDPR